MMKRHVELPVLDMSPLELSLPSSAQFDSETRLLVGPVQPSHNSPR